MRQSVKGNEAVNRWTKILVLGVWFLGSAASVLIPQAHAASTFVYVLVDPVYPVAAPPDGLNYGSKIEAFQCTSHGFRPIPDDATLLYGTPIRLIVSPNGRFLFEEYSPDATFQNPETGYIQYRILPDGRLRAWRGSGRGWFGGAQMGSRLSFDPSGKTAYMITSKAPYAIMSFRVKADGRFVPLLNTLPCGEYYSPPLCISQSGTAAYLPDIDGRLWQYSVALNGSLRARTPPYVSCGADVQIVVLPNGQGVYAVGYSPGIVHQFVTPSGLLHPTAPPLFPFGHYLFNIVASPDSRYVYIAGDDAFTSFIVVANGTLKRAAFCIPGSTGIMDPIAADLSSDRLYAIKSGRFLLAFTFAPDGSLRPIPRLKALLHGQARDVYVVHW